MRDCVTIQVGLNADQINRASELYWQAFGSKLTILMGPEARALRYLRRVVNCDHCIGALNANGELIGIAGFKTPMGSFAAGDARDMRVVYGLWGSFWRSLVLRLLTNEVDNQRFLIDGIAVCPSAQGQGVGTALLDELCQQAILRGYKMIRLEVIDTNTRAQKLYLREGFYELKRQNLGFLRYIFRFSGAIVMIKPLKNNKI